MALATTKVFLHIRADSDGDRTKHDAKKSLRKLAGGLTLTLDDADVVVFHHGSEMVLQNALGLRKPVVSPMWLKACKEAGRKLDVDPFVLVDSNSSAAVIKANASPVATPPKMLSKKPSPNATPPIPVGSANAAAKRPVVPSAPIALVDEEEDDDDDAALLAPKFPTSTAAAAAAASTTAMRPEDETPTPKKSASGRKSAAKAASDSHLAPAAVVHKIAPAAVARAAESNASAAATAAYLADLLDDEESPPPVSAPAAAKAKKPKAKAAAAKKPETDAASVTNVSPAGKKRGRTSKDTAVAAPTPPQPTADASDASSPAAAAAAAADPKRERKKPGPKPKQITTLTELARTQPAAACASPTAGKATLTASAASGAAAAASESPAKAAAGKKKAAAAAAKEAPAAPKPKAKKAKKKAVAAPVTVIAGSALRSSSGSSSSSSSDSDSDDGTGPGPARTSAAHRVVGGVHKYQIALTGVTADERESLGQIAVALGGEVVEEVFGRNGTKPTHLIADAATSSVSPKILLALGLGLPILRPAWLFSSLSHGRWLSVDGVDGDGQPFFVPSFDKASWLARQELMYHRDPRMLPDRPARGPQFLTGIVLYFAGASSYPDNNVWAELVHTVGGDVVRTVAAAGLSAVVLMSKDALKSGSGRGGATRSSSTLPKWLQNTPPTVPVITPQWIADSIAACATVPFDAHLAENVPARPSMGAAEALSSVIRAGVAAPCSDDSPPSLQVVVRTSTAPPGQRLSTGVAAAAAGRSPGTPHQAALAMALKKRSPGPSSAMKEAAHQWSTQMLRESLSPTRHDSDDDGP